MADELLLKDGVRYLLYTPKSEDEFERSIKHHARDIFGEDSLYFDIKKKIRSITGEGSIPDGYLVNFSQRQLHLIEIELSTHPEYDHIAKQVAKFLSALNNYQTRQKIASLLKDEIEADIVKTKWVRDSIGTKELYQFLLVDILEEVAKQNYQVIILIDQKTPELEEACKVLSPRPKIIEFKTYSRENVEGAKVHIHQFESLVNILNKNFDELHKFIMGLRGIQVEVKKSYNRYRKKERTIIYLTRYSDYVDVSLPYEIGRKITDPEGKLSRSGKYLYIDIDAESQHLIPYAKELIKQVYEIS